MKYLLVLAVVMVAFWAWRNNRAPRDPAPPRKPALRKPTVMVACLDCGMHLPQAEAVMGERGAYCCTEHRQRQEGAAR